MSSEEDALLGDARSMTTTSLEPFRGAVGLTVNLRGHSLPGVTGYMIRKAELGKYFNNMF